MFLDVDGVLNHTGLKEEFDSACMFQVLHIVTETQCKIVLSSTYRLAAESTKRFWDALMQVGISKQDYALPGHEQTPCFIYEGMDRTDEIVQCVRSVQESASFKVQSWVALDDADLLDQGTRDNSREITNHFVWIDPKFGIVSQNANDAVNILKS